MGRVSQALKKGGKSDLIDAFTKEATSGDYNNVINTCCKYVEVS